MSHVLDMESERDRSILDELLARRVLGWIPSPKYVYWLDANGERVGGSGALSCRRYWITLEAHTSRVRHGGRIVTPCSVFAPTTNVEAFRVVLRWIFDRGLVSRYLSMLYLELSRNPLVIPEGATWLDDPIDSADWALGAFVVVPLPYQCLAALKVVV